MSAFLVILISGVIVVLLAEWILWSLFRRRIAGMLLPHEADTSSLRFFTLLRLRLCALAHAIFLIATLVLSLLLLW